MNQAQLMQQVKKMQAEMVKAQEELANTTVQGSAANGIVTVDMTCDQRSNQSRSVRTPSIPTTSKRSKIS